MALVGAAVVEAEAVHKVLRAVAEPANPAGAAATPDRERIPLPNVLPDAKILPPPMVAGAFLPAVVALVRPAAAEIPYRFRATPPRDDPRAPDLRKVAATLRPWATSFGPERALN